MTTPLETGMKARIAELECGLEMEKRMRWDWESRCIQIRELVAPGYRPPHLDPHLPRKWFSIAENGKPDEEDGVTILFSSEIEALYYAIKNRTLPEDIKVEEKLLPEGAP